MKHKPLSPPDTAGQIRFVRFNSGGDVAIYEAGEK